MQPYQQHQLDRNQNVGVVALQSYPSVSDPVLDIKPSPTAASVSQNEQLRSLFEKTMVNPELCTHLLGKINQIQDRFQLYNLTTMDLKYLTESLITQFYRFAYGQESFRRLSSNKDQTALLEANAPIFTQLVLTLALNSEDGFDQVNKLLADGISHTKNMLQGSICKMDLSHFCRMTGLFKNDPCRETYYAATLTKLRPNSALVHGDLHILAALVLFWRGGMAMEMDREVDETHEQLLAMCLENNPRVDVQDYVHCQKNLHFMSTLFSL